MNDLVGLRTLDQDLFPSILEGEQYIAWQTAQLKREVLLFDKIALCDSISYFNESNPIWGIGSEWLNNVTWLIEQQVLFILDNGVTSDLALLQPEVSRYVSELIKSTKKFKIPKQREEAILKLPKSLMRRVRTLERSVNAFKANPDDIDKQLKAEEEISRWKEYLQGDAKALFDILQNRLQELNSVLLRIYALQMESLDNVSAIPLLSLPDYYIEIPTARKNDVIEIIINKLPLPSATTPWEAILDYRNDEDTRKSLRALRNWIRRISAKQLPVNEVEDELESLMDDFHSHMKLHKLKADNETLQTLVKAPLNVVESLVHLQPTKILDPLFVFQKRRISLMEAEINAPGKEIAYIFKTNETFNDSS